MIHVRGKLTLNKSHRFERFHILTQLGCAHLLMAHVLYLVYLMKLSSVSMQLISLNASLDQYS